MTRTLPLPAPPEDRTTRRPESVDPRLRERLWTLLCCLSLVLPATATRPARIVADTKIDMALAPARFLGRALHLWDVEQFGQLQNQAAGYLFPMGPFYLAGHAAGVPPWIVQRAWLALLLCTAFLGTLRLARRVGIGSPRARHAGALAYALAPHGLAALGTNSSEYLPLAMIPWMVLPLVDAARGGGRVRAAARSGLAVACCGGINGSATLAALAVPALFVLTRPWGRRDLGERGAPRLRILAWWSAAVVAATAWWSIPLLLLGRYAFSWLPYTERAVTTTATTGPVNVLRGTERWVDFLAVDGHAWWPLGHAFATGTLPALCTALVAALGTAGLVRARTPERTSLVTALLTGLVVMAAGHAGPLAPAVRHLIDGPLAPFRNLHKFDGLVRLPLALGLAHLLAGRSAAATGQASAWRTAARRWPAVAALAALAGVGGAALSNGLSAAGDFVQVPQYWRDAAAWLNARAGEQGVLAVPGSRFGEYIWGRPMDDVAQPLLRVRWAERQLVPAGSAGFTRLVDAIDQRISSGQGSAGLADVLARIGVRYLLVRNDLRRDDLRGAWPARVHQALGASPGIARVAWFGGVPAGSGWPDDAVGDVDQPYPPVEIYEVHGADDAVSVVDASRVLRLYGGPEALLTMADDGLLRGRPALLDGDDPGAGGRPVVADSLRRVERDFGELRGHTSPTMTAAQDRGVPGDRRDILEPGWDRYSTVAAYTGIKDVTASASASDISSIAQLDQPGGQPYSAVDGNIWTRWETGGGNGPVGQWLKVDFDRPLSPQGVTAIVAQDPSLGPPPATIAVETERGRVLQRLARTPDAQPLRAPAGTTSWLRVRILSLTRPPAVRAAARVAISELRIPGVRAGRTYHLPAVPAGGAVVMSRATGGLASCMRGSVRWVCSPSLERQDEEPYGFDRVFPMAEAGVGRLSGTATLTDPDTVQRYTNADPRLTVRASSSLTGGPADLPRSAFDADPATTWAPGPEDRTPWLSLSWRRRIRLRAITVKRPPGAPVLARVRVEGEHGQWRDVPVDSSGVLTFRPMVTRTLTLRFPDAGIQVTDVTVPGVHPVRTPPGGRIVLRCGYGPRLRIDGGLVRTRATGSFADVLAGRPLHFQACAAVRTRAGDNTLTPVPFDAFRVDSAVLDPAGDTAAPAPAPRPVTVTRWSAEHRVVRVAVTATSYLVVNENDNPGWRATIGGHTLRAVRLDGWRQAWVLPAGTTGTVRLTYAPDRTYQAALLIGLNLLLVLLLAALWPSRRRPGRAAPPRPPRGGARAVARAAAGVAVTGAIGYWLGGIGAAALGLALAAALTWAPRPLRPVLRSPWLPAAALFAATTSTLVGLHLDTRGDSSGTLYAETVPRLLTLIVIAALATPPHRYGEETDRELSRSRRTPPLV